MKIALFLLFSLSLNAFAIDFRSFTDQELQDLRSRKEIFLIYVWNPHMPYSVTSLPETKKWCKLKGIKFIPLLNNRFRGELPPVNASIDGKVYKLNSKTLTRLGADNHHPAYLLYSPKTQTFKNVYGYASPKKLSFLFFEDKQ